ncbi:MAG: hypothetical protein HY917_01470 [Candidatus Diapherotrites archaeon]|nr:hypothetical protein [Candidatus Diapherotrites archaeon]
MSKGFFLPALIQNDGAHEKIDSVLSGRGWRRMEYTNPLGNVSLVHWPYYFFHFDVYLPDRPKEKIPRGFLALDAVRMILTSQFAEMKETFKTKSTESLVTEFRDTYSEPAVSREEAQNLVRSRLASKFKVSLDTVLVSGMELVFVPFWKTQVKVAGNGFDLRLNAFNGHLFGAKKIPLREKDFQEVFDEVLHDFLNPLKWGPYIHSFLQPEKKHSEKKHGGH